MTAGAAAAGSPDRDEWQGLQARQAVAYHFLGRCFHAPPDAAWLEALARDRLFQAWPLPAGDEDTAAGLALLAAYCECWDRDQLGVLTWDFNRLFVGPGEMLAPPWESVHRSKTKLTFQESTLQVRALYEAFGVQAPALHREPDDHLALELDFLATLSERAVETAARGDGEQLEGCLRAQQAFLRDHLLAWAPACLALVERHAETDYYRGAAKLTRGSLAASARLCGARGSAG